MQIEQSPIQHIFITEAGHVPAHGDQADHGDGDQPMQQLGDQTEFMVAIKHVHGLASVTTSPWLDLGTPGRKG